MRGRESSRRARSAAPHLGPWVRGGGGPPARGEEPRPGPSRCRCPGSARPPGAPRAAGAIAHARSAHAPGGAVTAFSAVHNAPYWRVPAAVPAHWPRASPRRGGRHAPGRPDSPSASQLPSGDWWQRVRAAMMGAPRTPRVNAGGGGRRSRACSSASGAFTWQGALGTAERTRNMRTKSGVVPDTTDGRRPSPTAPRAEQCPNCGGQLAVNQDGWKICHTCGYASPP